MTGLTKTDPATLDALLIDIRAAFAEEARKRVNNIYPRERFIASDLHECDAYLTYSILNWQDRPKFDEYVAGLFEAGEEQERANIAKMMRLGFEVVDGQTPFEIKNRAGDIICRGRIDGMVKYAGDRFPFEHKLVDIHTFDAINGTEDFVKNLRLRRMMWQLQLYLYGHNRSMGFFFITDGRKHDKFIPVYLDLGAVEELLVRMERTWELVKTKTPGERMPYSDRVCSRCAFSTVCLPAIKAEGSEFIEDEELLGTLKEREALKPQAKRYEELDDMAKDRFKMLTRPAIVCSEFIVEPKRGERTTYNVPDDVKKQFSKKVPSLTLKITPVAPATPEVK